MAHPDPTGDRRESSSRILVESCRSEADALRHFGSDRPGRPGAPWPAHVAQSSRSGARPRASTCSDESPVAPAGDGGQHIPHPCLDFERTAPGFTQNAATHVMSPPHMPSRVTPTAVGPSQSLVRNRIVPPYSSFARGLDPRYQRASPLLVEDPACHAERSEGPVSCRVPFRGYPCQRATRCKSTAAGSPALIRRVLLQLPSRPSAAPAGNPC